MDKILKYLFMAQIHSDYAKVIQSFYSRYDEMYLDNRYSEYGVTEDALPKTTPGNYEKKETYIRLACREIVKRKDHSWQFFVTETGTRGPKWIIYFACRKNGQTYQVSFHSFDKSLAGFYAKEKTQTKIY